MKRLYILLLLSLGFGSAHAQDPIPSGFNGAIDSTIGVVFSPIPTSKARIVPISIDTAYALCELCKNQFKEGDDVALTTHVKGGAVEFLFRHQVCPAFVTNEIFTPNEKATYTIQQVKYLENVARDLQEMIRITKQYGKER